MNNSSNKAASVAGMRRYLADNAKGHARIMVQTLPTDQVRMQYAAAHPELRFDAEKLDSHAYGYELAARAAEGK